MPLKEIGSGFQVYVPPSQEEQLQSLNQQLGLVDLYNKIQAAPTERRKSEAEVLLKEAQVQDIETDRQNKADAASREASKFALDMMSNGIADLQSGNTGMGFLKIRAGGGGAAPRPGGGINVLYRGADGQQSVFPIFPGVITDPKIRLEQQTALRKEWNSERQKYEISDSYYNNLQTSLTRKNPISDQAALVALAKLWDPTSVVREGEVDVIKQTQSLPTWIKTEYERQLKDGGGVSEATRARMSVSGKDAFSRRYENSKMLAQTLYNSGLAVGLDPKSYLSPVGKGETLIAPEVFAKGYVPPTEEQQKQESKGPGIKSESSSPAKFSEKAFNDALFDGLGN